MTKPKGGDLWPKPPILRTLISEPDDDAGTSTALNPTEPDDGS